MDYTKHWNYPFCPRHQMTELKMMEALWKDGHIEFCPKGCLWGYDPAKKAWVLLKVVVV